MFNLETASMICVIICCSDFNIVNFVSFIIISADPKCIARDVFIMHGILLKNIMSMVMVMSQCSTSNSLGRLLSESSVTLSGVFCVVFPFRLPRFGPSKSSTCTMSSFVIGQFRIRLFSMYFIKS